MDICTLMGASGKESFYTIDEFKIYRTQRGKYTLPNEVEKRSKFKEVARRLAQLRPSSANTESMSSSLKHVQIDKKSRMSLGTLQEIMRIRTEATLCWLLGSSDGYNEPILISCYYGENEIGWRANKNSKPKAGFSCHLRLQMLTIHLLTQASIFQTTPPVMRHGLIKKIIFQDNNVPTERSLDDIPRTFRYVKGSEKYGSVEYCEDYFDVARLLSALNHFLANDAFSRAVFCDGNHSIQPWRE